MIKRKKLINFCNDYLNISHFSDDLPTGLQIEGTENIFKIALGVSASFELFQKAKEINAQMIIVHHGMFWKNEFPEIKNYKKNRIKFLLDNDISLAAYHLPLDAHPVIGNNIQIIKKLGLKKIKPFGIYKGVSYSFSGQYEKPLNFKTLLNKTEKIFKPERYIVFPYGKKDIKTIGIASGDASFSIHEAIDKKLDVFITGSSSESIQAITKEEKINFIAVGHYNSEKFGVQALGRLITKKFNIPTEFIDIPNPD